MILASHPLSSIILEWRRRSHWHWLIEGSETTSLRRRVHCDVIFLVNVFLLEEQQHMFDGRRHLTYTAWRACPRISPIRDSAILLHFKRFQWISREIMCHYCDFNLHTCLLFTSFTVKPLNIWHQDETADVNQVKTIVNQVENYESSEKLFPPRWKCFHRGDNYFHRGGNVSTAVEMFPPRW